MDQPDIQLELQVVKTGEDDYTAVVPGPHGAGTSGAFRLDFTDEELDGYFLALGQLQSGVGRTGPAQLASLRELGTRLFDHLFAGEIAAWLDQARERASARGTGVCIRLQLSDAPELFHLPWELLHDGRNGRFLALDERIALLRQLPAQALELPPVFSPLRVLVVAGSQSKTAKRALEELEGALGALGTQGAVEVEFFRSATISRLESRLAAQPLHVLHFIGGGAWDAETREGSLAFKAAKGRGGAAGAGMLAEMLGAHGQLRLAVLQSGGRGGADVFGAVGRTLVERAVPAVVAMRFPLDESASAAFARDLYGGLLAGLSVDRALAGARRAVRSAASEDSLDWASPVLYMRPGEVRLEIFEPGVRPEAAPTAEAADMEPVSAARPEPAGQTAPVPEPVTAGEPEPVQEPVTAGEPGPAAEPVPAKEETEGERVAAGTGDQAPTGEQPAEALAAAVAPVPTAPAAGPGRWALAAVVAYVIAAAAATWWTMGTKQGVRVARAPSGLEPSSVVVPPPEPVPPALPGPATMSGPSQPLRAGSLFQECAGCPQMVVVVPQGPVRLGSPANEDGRADNEAQSVPVGLAPYAIGRFEVTFDEWAACVKGGGCAGNRDPGDAGWGRGRRPVIMVAWNDAREYVQWLSRATGKDYRLPSEAQWEHAARGGTATRQSWGVADACDYANQRNCLFGRTLATGSLKPNGYGLYDTSGNVGEWVQDCYRDRFDPGIKDGRPFDPDGACEKRVVRGGSWSSRPETVRPANRGRIGPDNRYDYLGFRVVRTLP